MPSDFIKKTYGKAVDENRRVKVSHSKTTEHTKFVPKVESGIPLAAKNSNRKRNIASYYPFAQMKVGDSFCIPINGGSVQTTVNVQALKWAKKHAPTTHFAVRTVEEVTWFSGGELLTVVRCWRIV